MWQSKEFIYTAALLAALFCAAIVSNVESVVEPSLFLDVMLRMWL